MKAVFLSFVIALTAAHASSVTAFTSDDELLYREALRLGLDRGLKRPPEAGALRKVLTEQMRVLLSRPEGEERISDAEIREYYLSHLDRFRVPSRVSFRQIFLAAPRAQANLRAGKLLPKLRSGAISWKQAKKRTDPLPLGPEFRFASEEFISRRFGDRFALALRGLKLKHWSGPVESALGLHLIRIEKRAAPRFAPIASVRPTIVAAISKERAARRLARAIGQLTSAQKRPLQIKSTNR